jgi:saccharopine dehydrogenase (NAD+, L-lysine-forming)
VSLLIYGVTGCVGSMVSRTATAYRMPHIVAGRNPEGVHAISQWAGLEGRAFEVEDPQEIAKWLVGVKVVINCAGPFDETAAALAQGCMLVGAHYLDISDRAADHLAMQALEPAAIQAGVMLLPGVGSSLLPADCLAKLVVAQVASPTHLTLAFQSEGKISRGMTASRLDGMAEPGFLRTNGTLRPCYPGVSDRTFTMNDKSVSMLTDPWRAEQVGVFHSTGIRNIETYSNFSRAARFMLKVPGQIESGAMKWFVDRTIRKTPVSPSENAIYKGSSSIFAEAKNKAGDKSSLTMVGPGVIHLTALTAVACGHAAQQTPNLRPGYQTPARAFGAELIGNIDGVQVSS